MPLVPPVEAVCCQHTTYRQKTKEKKQREAISSGHLYDPALVCPGGGVVVHSRATSASLLPPVVWEGSYVKVLRKSDSNDIISTVKWSA